MKQQHTIILVPHARAKFRKWRFTSLQAGIGLAALTLVTLGGLIATVLFFTATVERQALSALEAENEQLRQVNDEFEQKVLTLKGKLDESEEHIRELAIVAGLSLMPQHETGIGGVGPAKPAVDGELRLVESGLTRLDRAIADVENKLAEHTLRIATTPAITPVKGLISSGFGPRRDPFTGRRAFHNGIDIIAPRGREVRATGGGIVTRAGNLGALGNAVYVTHGYGITTRYGHLARLAVEPGTRIERGDVVGFVGKSGRSTGNHLHYEVRIDGEPVDPRVYILDGVRR